jgi:hypothetical protein
VAQVVLFEGKNRVRVYEPGGDPPHGFAPAEPTLEEPICSRCGAISATPLPFRQCMDKTQRRSLADGFLSKTRGNAPQSKQWIEQP